MRKRVLLADDDVDDVLLFKEVFSDLPSDEYELITVDHGEAVMTFLDDTSDDTRLPHLIILDQNMPLMTGKETLEKLKASARYNAIPVVVYSTYNDKSFIEECSALGVQAVVSKPDSYEGYIHMINNLLRYSSDAP